MGTADLVSAVAERAGAKAAAAAGEYDRLVRAAARGEPGDPDEAVRVLEAAGKSATAFATDVSGGRRRGQLQALADTVPGLTAERAEVERKISDLVRQRDAAVATANKQIRGLEAESAALIEQIQRGDDAKQQLAAERAKSRS